MSLNLDFVYASLHGHQTGRVGHRARACAGRRAVNALGALPLTRPAEAAAISLAAAPEEAPTVEASVQPTSWMHLRELSGKAMLNGDAAADGAAAPNANGSGSVSGSFRSAKKAAAAADEAAVPRRSSGRTRELSSASRARRRRRRIRRAGAARARSCPGCRPGFLEGELLFKEVTTCRCARGSV